VRQLRIRGAHGCDQGIDHFALDAIIKIARVGDVGKTAPAVGNFLILRQRVGDERKLPIVVFVRFFVMIVVLC
jgi:hypothetical protein